MYLLGYSLNNLTLMALTISTGFVVDDAIVMIENIDRYLEEGDSPLEAALKGAGQIGFTIVSLTVSLIAVLIPLAVHGRHRRPPVSRIRRDPGGHDSGFRRGVADPDADDVRQAAEAPRSRTRKPLLQVTENFYNRVIEFYGRTSEIGSETPDHHFAGHGRAPWS